MFELEGEWTLITGATSGIGLEMARILAGRGINLVLVSRSEERLCEVARELNEISDIIIMPYDLSSPGSALAIHDECRRLGLKVDTLINNAGFGKFGESSELDPSDIESMLGLNMTALTLLCNLFAAGMKAAGRGHIMNVASTAAFVPIPYFSAYSASKAYVRNFSYALREELKEYGIKVTCLLPGATDTKFADVAFLNGERKFFDMQRPMSAATVAAAGLKGMYRGRRKVVPGQVNKLVAVSAAMVPVAAIGRVIRGFARHRDN
jgi:short-subunit dehydrogenase